MVLPALVLQKPHRTSKTKDHIKCLDMRLEKWKDGNLNELVKEGTPHFLVITWLYFLTKFSNCYK